MQAFAIQNIYFTNSLLYFVIDRMSSTESSNRNFVLFELYKFIRYSRFSGLAEITHSNLIMATDKKQFINHPKYYLKNISCSKMK